jgi:hypothetical protein
MPLFSSQRKTIGNDDREREGLKEGRREDGFSMAWTS